MRIRRNRPLSKEKQELLDKAIDKMLPKDKDPFDSFGTTVTNIMASTDGTSIMDTLKEMQVTINHQGFLINEIYTHLHKHEGL